MGKMKDLLIELLEEAEVPKNVTECPVVASVFKPFDGKDFMHRDKGNFISLWWAAEVANKKLSVLISMNDRLVAKNKALTAALELLKQQMKHRGN